ncbi:PREDICTED: uncharacterized protein LOC106551084 [Thamnophis sirtalis]|uniref:Uncharacterized protein LOC106551084 n=1 Tax=Thamnophis sirtalis TaxID=35019 RepID=A0A6I9YK04_9SAUR|nr:PREDICTED: uncharacterized protein LOC106551084 [Thamnophis sirtalis]
MTYEEMMTLTEQHLESQNVTKGARHKIALSIQKLRERQSVLKSLEKDVLEGGNLWNALQELQQILTTPIKAFHTLHAASASKEAQPLAAEPRGGPTLGLEKSSNEDKEATDDPFPPPTGSPCDGESGAAPIAEGDIAGQFTRVMGKETFENHTNLFTRTREADAPERPSLNAYLDIQNGRLAIITCLVDSYPPSRLTMYKGGQRLNITKSFSPAGQHFHTFYSENSLRLEIQGLTEKDSGDFVCQADNPFGNATSSIAFDAGLLSERKTFMVLTGVAFALLCIAALAGLVFLLQTNDSRIFQKCIGWTKGTSNKEEVRQDGNAEEAIQPVQTGISEDQLQLPTSVRWGDVEAPKVAV